VEHPGGISSSQGPTVLGNPVPRDGSELRPSSSISRKWERDRGSVCEEDSPREDIEGRLAGGEWRMEVHWGGPCEQVREQRFLGSGVPAKQLRYRRKRMWVERERESGMGWGRPEEQGQCRDCTWSLSWHQNVRKNAAYKESSREKSHTQEQSLMAGMSCLTDRRKMAQGVALGQESPFIEEGG
jgi:hypothetical protein